jgi:hypothetical protein
MCLFHISLHRSISCTSSLCIHSFIGPHLAHCCHHSTISSPFVYFHRLRHNSIPQSYPASQKKHFSILSDPLSSSSFKPFSSTIDCLPFQVSPLSYALYALWSIPHTHSVRPNSRFSPSRLHFALLSLLFCLCVCSPLHLLSVIISHIVIFLTLPLFVVSYAPLFQSPSSTITY